MAPPRVWVTSSGFLLYYLKLICGFGHFYDYIRVAPWTLYQNVGILGILAFIVHLIAYGVITGCVIKFVWHYYRSFIRRIVLPDPRLDNFIRQTRFDGICILLLEIWIGFSFAGPGAVSAWSSCICYTNPHLTHLFARALMTAAVPVIVGKLMYKLTEMHFQNEVME